MNSAQILDSTSQNLDSTSYDPPEQSIVSRELALLPRFI